MSITATVEHDVIKLPKGVHLPDGTEVIVLPREKKVGSFAERHAHLIGTEGSGVGDLAEHHDRYLTGSHQKPQS